jgi:hypothetical protein
MLRKLTRPRNVGPVPQTEPLPLDGLPKRKRRGERPPAPILKLPTPAVQPDPEPEPAPVTVSKLLSMSAGTAEPEIKLDLRALEAIITQCAADFPEQVDEWSTYLVYLREHATQDGFLPARFEGLVADVFGPALQVSPARLERQAAASPTDFSAA